MYRAIAANKRNTVLIMLAFVAIVGAIGAIVSLFMENNQIMIPVIIIAAIYALIQYFVATKLAVSMTGARQIERKDNPRLYHIVETLSITTGLPMPKVYVIDDPAPNAFAAGRNPKNAVVAATTGLMDIMDDRELEAVMAHEMAHVQNYDIRVSMITFGLVCAIGLVSDLAGRILIGGSSNRNGGPALMIIGLLVMILAPLTAVLVQMAVSRQREYLADASAAMITRYPEGMVSALQKLKQHTKPMKKQNMATEALFINNPLKKGFLSKMFSTHPPIEQRVERLKQNKAKF